MCVYRHDPAEGQLRKPDCLPSCIECFWGPACGCQVMFQQQGCQQNRGVADAGAGHCGGAPAHLQTAAPYTWGYVPTLGTSHALCPHVQQQQQQGPTCSEPHSWVLGDWLKAGWAPCFTRHAGLTAAGEVQAVASRDPLHGRMKLRHASVYERGSEQAWDLAEAHALLSAWWCSQTPGRSAPAPCVHSTSVGVAAARRPLWHALRP